MCVPPGTRGGRASSRTRVGMRWTRAASARDVNHRAVFREWLAARMTNDAAGVRQNRVVLAAVAAVKLRGGVLGPTGRGASRIRGATVTTRTRRRGERGISRQATAQGRPDVFGFHLYARVRHLPALLAHETAGAGRHPVFPAPSSFKRVRNSSKARACRAARRRRRVCLPETALML